MRQLTPLVVRITLVLGCCVVSSGCGYDYRTVVVYDPPLQQHVSAIVPGRTTEAEIRATFGVPYLEVDGDRVVIRGDSPMGQSREESRQRIELQRRQLKARMAESGQDSRHALPGDYYEWDRMLERKSWVYSSIDSRHKALLYYEMNQSDRLVMAGGLGAAHSKLRRNQLLVLINKETGLVTDYGWKQEFDAE